MGNYNGLLNTHAYCYIHTKVTNVALESISTIQSSVKMGHVYTPGFATVLKQLNSTPLHVLQFNSHPFNIHLDCLHIFITIYNIMNIFVHIHLHFNMHKSLQVEF